MARRVEVLGRDGVALVTLEGADEGPKGCGFDPALRQALAAALNEAFEIPELQAIVLRAGAGGWPRAADVLDDYGPEAPTLADLCDRLAQAPVPVVAVLSGTISGGALALSQVPGLRLALPSTRFHCPEAGMNLLPAAGGTVRLVRRSGGAALELLLSGRMIRAEDGMQLGLCDAVASEGTIETSALTEALRGAAAGVNSPFAPRDGALSNVGAALDALTAARTRYAAKSDLPALARIAEVAEAALLLPLAAALDYEAVAFADLAGSETAAALRSNARAHRAVQTLAGVPTEGIAPVTRVALWNPTTRHVAALLGRGLAVQVGTSDPERLQPLLTGVARAQEAAEAAGELDPARRAADWARLEPVTGPEAFGPTDLLIATPFTVEERNRLRQHLPAGAVLALSGAAPGPGELGIDRSQRLAAIWTGTPALIPQIPRLAAVLRADGTRVIHAAALALHLEACFFVAAERCVLAGASPATVDVAMMRWGFAEGPFARFDRIGAAAACTRMMAAGVPPGPFLSSLPGQGRHGRVAGSGVFLWTPEGVPQPWPGETFWLETMRVAQGITARKLSEDEIAARVVAELAGLGLVALQAGAARRCGDIDLMAEVEIGFPARKGGPMFQADRIGALALRKRLRALAAEGALAPAPLLDALIRDGARLSERFG